MIVEPAGSSFLTAQKTRGRAHRFFACHFLAYAQGANQTEHQRDENAHCAMWLPRALRRALSRNDNAHALRAKNWSGVMRLRQRFASKQSLRRGISAVWSGRRGGVEG